MTNFTLNLDKYLFIIRKYFVCYYKTLFVFFYNGYREV